MKRLDAVRLFGLNNLSIEAEIRRIELDLDVDFGHRAVEKDSEDQAYYPQFSERLRAQADAMSNHYMVFYCLKNSIRELIVDRLEEVHGASWWNSAVPEGVRKNAEANRRREAGTGVTLRSPDLIDYITFGELGEIIKMNWDVFGDMFRDVRAIERVLASLNTLRGPIAHCKPLAEDEVVRLHLSLRDWFRQMA
jgi:hypothetical protein